MTEAAILLEDVGFAYRPGEWVLRGVSARLERGRIMALLGPNGRGKTTLLKLLLGLLAPSEGRALLAARAAFVPQLFRTAFAYTALDMVVMGRAREIGLWSQPSAADEADALEMLARLDLAPLAARAFDTLSGGERQLVILARALLARADILILDEPCSALDLGNQSRVLRQLARLAREDGITILFTTHAPQHAAAIADEVLLLTRNGAHVAGPLAATLTPDALEQTFDVPFSLVPNAHDGRPLLGPTL